MRITFGWLSNEWAVERVRDSACCCLLLLLWASHCEAVSTLTRRNDPPQTSEQETLEQQVESLRSDIRKFEIEPDILKKANEILKKARASTRDS
jgi:hypothetical protein